MSEAATAFVGVLIEEREHGAVARVTIENAAKLNTLGSQLMIELVEKVEALATRRYRNRDIGAAVASGSFKTAGMVIVPCSIKSAAAVAHCAADTLIARAADVTLKEGRPLILVVRETPLHLGHLRVLTALAEMGAVILPPMPAFYNRPKQIDDLVTHTLARVLDRLGLPHTLAPEWQGTAPRVPPPAGA